MNKERELLKTILAYMCAEYLVITEFEMITQIEDTVKETQNLLAQPEEGVYQKLLRIEDGVEVEILPSELWQDGYETGKRSVLLSKQPEQEPVAWIIETEIHGKLSEWVCTDKKRYLEEHDSIKEPIPLYLAPPKQEPLSVERIADLWTDINTNSVRNFARAIEKEHGIGGGEC